MSIRFRINRPPQVADHNLNVWFDQVTDAINQLPNFSMSSTTNGPNSQVTGDSGTILIDVGSSATTFWAKLSGTTTSGWTPFYL